ncbi:MAG: S41 family peptidase [Candidatus Colwellbacteria bacterium]|nr:S41 family peptidase [Candidatus Colwellbacteria bacterium]
MPMNIKSVLEKLKNNKLFLAIGVLICVLIASGAIFYGGYLIGQKETKEIKIVGVADITPGSEVSADFSIFWQAWDKIKREYLRSGGVSEKDMVYAAIKGLAENIGDPYTTFFSPEDAKKFSEDVDGRFGGIGAELGQSDGQVIVVAPLENTPAARAGIQAKDIIVKAGDTDMYGKSVEEAVKIIRGEPGTEIKLVIVREGADGPIEITLKREIIEVPNIKWSIKEGDILYLKLQSFSQTAPDSFYKAVFDASKENPRGMILDLRNDPGGYLETAVNIAGWFIDRGEVAVIERYSSGEETVYRSYGNEVLKDFPVVVLVNGGTASASEILAGAMRDHNGTKLIGSKTFGKGTVQTLEDLKDGSMLKITVANWVTPKGTILEGEGLDVDVEVKNTAEDIKAGKDIELEKAIETLREEINR